MGLLPLSKPAGNAAPEAAAEGAARDPSKYVEDGEPNVSAEEQAEYDEFMNHAAELMYIGGDGNQEAGVRPEILQALDISDDEPAPAATATPQAPAPVPAQAQPVEGTANPVPAGGDEMAPPAADTGQPVEPGAEKVSNPNIMALAQTAVTIITKLDDSAREQGKVISEEVLMHGGVAVIEELGEIAEAAKLYDYTPEDLTGAVQLAIDLYRPKLIADGRTSEDTLKAQFAEINEADSAGKLGDVLPGLGGGTTMGEAPVAAA